MHFFACAGSARNYDNQNGRTAGVHLHPVWRRSDLSGPRYGRPLETVAVRKIRPKYTQNEENTDIDIDIDIDIKYQYQYQYQ